MKKLTIIFLLAINFSGSSQNCSPLFSFGAYFEKVHFYNQSTVPNAHYYWNFGDGTSSYYKNPIHEFPANGTYLVTLYSNDTINNCSNYYDMWLNVTKTSTLSCSVTISESISSDATWDYIKLISHPSNCTGYDNQFFFGGGNGGGGTDYSFIVSKMSANYLGGVRYFDGFTNEAVAMKTSPNRFNRNKNYNSCSANFEFSVVSEDINGQRILFKAMNKNALSYKWMITGFGDPKISYYDTVSVRYGGAPFAPYIDISPYIYLFTTDNNGCKDSLIQNISIKSKTATTIGLDEIQESRFNIEFYPNPVKDKLIFNFDKKYFELKEISITNSLGQLVYISNNIPPSNEIDLGFLSTGFYFLTIQNQDQKRVFKIIKE